jgi:hypothetical protein
VCAGGEEGKYERIHEGTDWSERDGQGAVMSGGRDFEGGRGFKGKSALGAGNG